MTNNLKIKILREKYCVDIEIQPVQVIVISDDAYNGKWKKIGYRYIVSEWSEEGILKSRYFSHPEKTDFETYDAAEEDALIYIDEHVVKVQ